MPSIPETDIDRPAHQTQQPAAIGSCQPGAYPWDHWQTRALAHGLAADLASLGRAVMREASQHNWSDHLQGECGWFDNGQQMLDLAISEPEQAAQRWEHLLITDGETVRINPKTGMRESRY